MAGPTKYPLQTKFWKNFGRYGIFLGTVVGYSDHGVYKCYYEGDGDKEDLTEEEIEIWLKRYPSVAKMNQDASKKKRTNEEQPGTEQAIKPTPEKHHSKGPPKVITAKTEHKAKEQQWKESLQKLKAFRKANGHARVPNHWRQDPRLANWVSKQRERYKQGKIQPHRQILLEQEGFEFVLWKTRSWDETYQLLVDHKKKFGGFSNIAWDSPHKHLYKWITVQKKAYWEGRLPADRKKLLHKLGLELKKQLRTFEESFHLLLEFQKIHSHTNVPKGYQDQKLAHFVKKKRRQHRTNEIPQDQKEELDKIGFQFWVRAKPRTFEEHYGLLLEFKEEFGHVNVPQKCQWDEMLGRWVNNVRSGNIKLNEIKKKKLDDIGFEWHQRRNWQESFDALYSYQKKHGNCDVPYNYKKDAPLASWVCDHKRSKRYNALDPEKKEQLKAIGFHPNQEAAKLTSSLETNSTVHHGSKRKQGKATTNTRSSQATSQPLNQATKSTHAAKKRAGRKIENQVDQESSIDESGSDVDSYESDEFLTWSESTTMTPYHEDAGSFMGDDAAPVGIRNGNQLDCPEEVISTQSQAKERCLSASEVAPDKVESSTPPTESTTSSAARRRRQNEENASIVAPELARSSSAKTPDPTTHSRQLRGKTAVPETARSEPQSGGIVPDATESSSISAPPPRAQRGWRKWQQEEGESNKKPRWLFD